MKIARECIPCLARQATEIAEEATECPKLQEEIIKASLQEIANLSFDFMAPEIAHKMHHHARRVTGVIDPYREQKQMYNAVALEIADMLREDKRVENSPSPFDTACRISIAGNIIDFSAGLTLGYDEVRRSVEESLEKPLFGVGTATLEEAVGKATNMLFLVDNSGEIVFDRFLIEMLPLDRVTVVVKGGPIVNDATMEDAVVAGLTDIVKVIDNGHDAQGTILSACSQPFLQAFEQADLIISKGQANFETLSDIRDKRIFYLLRAKCQAVASAIGCERMAYVLTDATFSFRNRLQR